MAEHDAITNGVRFLGSLGIVISEEALEAIAGHLGMISKHLGAPANLDLGRAIFTADYAQEMLSATEVLFHSESILPESDTLN